MGLFTTIYALCDPNTKDIRYIGKTSVPLHIRLSQHISAARKFRRNHLHHWILSLAVRPTMKPLVLVQHDCASDVEIRTIASYRSHGYRLTNSTGRKNTPETIAKMSAAAYARHAREKLAVG